MSSNTLPRLGFGLADQPRPVSLHHWVQQQQQHVMNHDHDMICFDGVPCTALQTAHSSRPNHFSFSSSCCTGNQAPPVPMCDPEYAKDAMHEAHAGDGLDLWRELDASVPRAPFSGVPLLGGGVLHAHECLADEEDALLRTLVQDDDHEHHMGDLSLDGAHGKHGAAVDTPQPPAPSPAEASGPDTIDSFAGLPRQAGATHFLAGHHVLAPSQRVFSSTPGSAGAPASGMHSPNRSESSSWCTGVRMIPPSDPSPMLRVLSAPGLFLPGRQRVQRQASFTPSDVPSNGSMFSTLRRLGPLYDASLLSAATTQSLHPGSPQVGGTPMDMAQDPAIPAARLPQFLNLASAGSTPQPTQVFSASSALGTAQMLTSSAIVLPAHVSPVCGGVRTPSSGDSVSGMQSAAGRGWAPAPSPLQPGGSPRDTSPHARAECSPRAPLQELDVPPSMLHTGSRHTTFLLNPQPSQLRPQLPVPPDSPFSDDGSGFHVLTPNPAPGHGWSPANLTAAAAAHSPFRSRAHLSSDMAGSPRGAQPVSPQGSMAWSQGGARGGGGVGGCCGGLDVRTHPLTRHSTPAALDALMPPAPRSPAVKRAASADGGDAWMAMERVYGPSIKCPSGACGGLFDQPCDDHKCACCKTGRRVAAFEKQGFCGPCGRRETVTGLRFIRCGMCKAEMVERAYDAHLKQYVIMQDPASGKKTPVKCKEHMTTHPKEVLPATCGRRCSKCNNMRPLSYYASEDSTCNWHIAQRHMATTRSANA